MTYEIADLASLYASQGFAVFPCKRTGEKRKAPMTSNGFYSAKSDAYSVGAMFATTDNPLIGIACGEISGGLVVLDLDVNKDGDNTNIDHKINLIKANFGEIPETFTVNTPSGGKHFYFIDNTNSIGSSNKIFQGLSEFPKDIRNLSVDVKGNGGYVIAADNQEYLTEQNLENVKISTVPDWLVGLFKDKKSTITQVIDFHYDQKTNQTILSDQSIAEYQRILDLISPDGYKEWYQIGMALKSTGAIQAFDLWNNWSKRSAKYNENEAKRKWNEDFNPRRTSMQKLFFIAKELGHDVKIPYEHEELLFNTESILMLANKRRAERAKIENKSEHIQKFPFPDELLRPPGIVGEIVDYINSQAIIPQPVLSVGAAFTVAGMIMGRRFETPTGLRTNLYTLSVAESGTGKEAARKSIKNILSAVGKNAQNSDGLSKHFSDNISSDVAVSNLARKYKRVMLLLDEMGLLLKQTRGNGASSLEALPKMLNELYTTTTGWRKSYANDENDLEFTDPAVCIYGTTTPGQFLQNLDVAHGENGFLNRFMIYFSETNLDDLKREIGDSNKRKPDLDAELIRKLNLINDSPENCSSIGNYEKLMTVSPRVVGFDYEAMCIETEFHNQIYKIASEASKRGLSASYFMRLPQQAVQIALILAVGKAASSSKDPSNKVLIPEIDKECMEYAIKLVNYTNNNLIVVMDSAFENKDEFNLKRVLQKIEGSKKDGMTPKTLLNRITSLKVHDLDEILKRLEIMGKIVAVDHKGANNKATVKYYSIKYFDIDEHFNSMQQ